MDAINNAASEFVAGAQDAFSAARGTYEDAKDVMSEMQGNEAKDKERGHEDSSLTGGVDAAGNPAGDHHTVAESVGGHTKHKLSYDGAAVLRTPGAYPPPSGVDPTAWKDILDCIQQAIRTFNASRGWGLLRLWALKGTITLIAWYVVNFLVNIFVVDFLVNFLVNNLPFNETLSSAITFTVFYGTELAVFSLPSYIVGGAEEKYETKQYNELQERVFHVSQDMGEPSSIRLVLRFAKGTDHPRKLVYVACALLASCLKFSVMSADHRYDLHVLPWDVEKMKYITVRCQRCGKVMVVDTSQTHVRCKRCLACSALGLPTIAACEILSPETATRRVHHWSSVPSRRTTGGASVRSRRIPSQRAPMSSAIV